MKSGLEATASILFKSMGLDPVQEYRFHPVRRWRFDFAFPEHKVAVEIEGGTFGKCKSRHTTGTGYEKDCEKYNAAILNGWRVFRFTGRMITVDNFNDVKELIEEGKC